MTNSNPIKVLIAEDDPMVGEMIHGMLEDTGYEVVGRALDGLQAIEMVQSHQPHVVLMDLEMPNLGGIAATANIINNTPVPVVILTAYDSPELVQQASQAGAGAYLVKPPNEHEIDRAITIAMGRFKDLMALRRLNAELELALAHVKQLSGLLPICANCKKIRDDAGYWQEVEVYISEHSDVEFSHGLCPDCMNRLYPGFLSNM
ncbi:MAG: Chemotaxis response regulator protein-glutamate methylesterase [Anaerolineae bacterium]|nr:Chemotaxis response regulator protein-glutamate methylesterase [Anaerolineae bacterium]